MESNTNIMDAKTSMPSNPSSSAVATRTSMMSHSLLRTATLVILPLLSILGIYGGYILSAQNGMFDIITSIVANETSTLPGTNDPLLKKYTAIGFVDHQLAVLVTFFAPVVDRSHAGLGLFSLDGLGQFGAAWTLLMMESLRVGNKGTAATFIGTAGFFIQNISFQVTVPIYLFLHLLTSPTAKPFSPTNPSRVLLIPNLDLQILPISITLSYLVPTRLMALPAPSMVSPAMHQYLIAFWQPFPIWTIIILWSIRQLFQDKMNPIITPTGSSYLAAVKRVYQFAIGLCLVTHAPVLFFALLPPGIIPATAPEIAKLASSNFIDVFVPYFTSTHRVISLAEGVLNFLKWDLHVGSIATLLWAVVMYWNAAMDETSVGSSSVTVYKDPSSGQRLDLGALVVKVARKVAVWTVLAGPVGAAAMLLWERDAVVEQKVKDGN